MRCGCTNAGDGACCLKAPCATAERGFLGSSAAAGTDLPPAGTPDGGGTDTSGIWRHWRHASRDRRLHGGCGNACGPGAGTAEPGVGPILCRRDFRSIFGFCCSAIVRVATLRVPALACQSRAVRSPQLCMVGAGPRPIGDANRSVIRRPSRALAISDAANVGRH